MSPFTGKTAMVTGAASGIGAALAAGLRSQGATVITTDVEGDVDRELDVRDLAAFRSLVDACGVPDLLFSNAGVAMGGPTHELTRAHWDHVIDVNLNGVVKGLLAVYPQMAERGSGHIVATASGVASRLRPSSRRMPRPSMRSWGSRSVCGRRPHCTG